MNCHFNTALQTQSLSLLLSGKAGGADLDGNEVSSPSQLALGQECMLREERFEEAVAGYNALKGLDSANSDVRAITMYEPSC